MTPLMKRLAYVNIASLALNGIIVWLMVAKTFPALLGILFVIGFLGGAIWLSCYMNGVLPRQKRQRSDPLYAAPTERMERL